MKKFFNYFYFCSNTKEKMGGSVFFFSEGGAEICRKEFPAHSPDTPSHIICKYYLAFKVFKGCFSVSVFFLNTGFSTSG